VCVCVCGVCVCVCVRRYSCIRSLIAEIDELIKESSVTVWDRRQWSSKGRPAFIDYRVCVCLSVCLCVSVFGIDVNGHPRADLLSSTTVYVCGGVALFYGVGLYVMMMTMMMTMMSPCACVFCDATLCVCVCLSLLMSVLMSPCV